MKRFICVLCSFIIFLSIWGSENSGIEKLNNEFDKYPRCYHFSEQFAIARGDDFIIIKDWFNHDAIVKLYFNDIKTDDYGFRYFLFDRQKVLIIGGSIFFCTFGYSDASKQTYPFGAMMYEKAPKDFNKFLRQILRFIPDAKESTNYIPLFSIAKIKTSSYYTEVLKNGTKISYEAQYLNMIFHFCDIDTTHFLLRNPWVPGKKSNPAGIGESLTIEFAEPKDNIVVLNGYVDLEKRYLYKANNRVKTAVVTALDESNPFEFEYRFEDFVHFAEIDFPAKVSKVSFTIKDVYNGEKWNDTCVTAVITRRD